jgi:hypothetical protein
MDPNQYLIDGPPDAYDQVASVSTPSSNPNGDPNNGTNGQYAMGGGGVYQPYATGYDQLNPIMQQQYQQLVNQNWAQNQMQTAMALPQDSPYKSTMVQQALGGFDPRGTGQAYNADAQPTTAPSASMLTPQQLAQDPQLASALGSVSQYEQANRGIPLGLGAASMDSGAGYDMSNFSDPSQGSGSPITPTAQSLAPGGLFGDSPSGQAQGMLSAPMGAPQGMNMGQSTPSGGLSGGLPGYSTAPGGLFGDSLSPSGTQTGPGIMSYPGASTYGSTPGGTSINNYRGADQQSVFGNSRAWTPPGQSGPAQVTNGNLGNQSSWQGPNPGWLPDNVNTVQNPAASQGSSAGNTEALMAGPQQTSWTPPQGLSSPLEPMFSSAVAGGQGLTLPASSFSAADYADAGYPNASSAISNPSRDLFQQQLGNDNGLAQAADYQKSLPMNPMINSQNPFGTVLDPNSLAGTYAPEQPQGGWQTNYPPRPTVPPNSSPQQPSGGWGNYGAPPLPPMNPSTQNGSSIPSGSFGNFLSSNNTGLDSGVTGVQTSRPNTSQNSNGGLGAGVFDNSGFQSQSPMGQFIQGGMAFANRLFGNQQQPGQTPFTGR